MPKVQCNNCKKQVNAPENWNRNEKCTTCDSYFSEINNQLQVPSISSQLNEIGRDMGNNISSIPHIIIGKDRNTQQKQNNPNLNTQNANLGYPAPQLDKDYNKFEKIRMYGMWGIILLVIGYAGFRIFKIIFFGA